MGCVVASIPNRTADAIHHDIGHAHGLQVAKKPKYMLFSKDPAKYLDLQEYLPHRESLTEDFNWVEPCSMSLEQLFVWACHLFDLGRWAMYGRTRILSGQHEREFAARLRGRQAEQTHLPHLGRLCKRATYHKA